MPLPYPFILYFPFGGNETAIYQEGEYFSNIEIHNLAKQRDFNAAKWKSKNNQDFLITKHGQQPLYH